MSKKKNFNHAIEPNRILTFLFLHPGSGIIKVHELSVDEEKLLSKYVYIKQIVFVRF